jgi:hypothetical protein
MQIKFLLLSLAFFPSSFSTSAQVHDFAADRVQIVVLNQWRFHTGDDAKWADPAFDDSGWSQLRADKSYYDQGYGGYSGLGWYRLQVILPAKPTHLAIVIPYIKDSYQVFANGELIGAVGDMPPQPRVVVSIWKLLSIPENIAPPGQPLTLAVRVWRWPRMAMYSGGGMNGPPFLGDAHQVAIMKTLAAHDLYWNESDTVMIFFANLLTALAGLALFALRRSEREYLWFGAAQAFWAVQSVGMILPIYRPLPYVPVMVAVYFAMACAMFLNLEFFVTLLGQRKRLLYWTAALSVVLSALLLAASAAGWISEPHRSSAATALDLLYGVCVPAMLFRGTRSGMLEARLLLFPFTLSFLCNFVASFTSLPAIAARPWVQAFWAGFWQVFSWPFPMKATDLAGFLAMFSVVAVLVFRYARSRKDEERLEAELNAARAVQHVLVPDEIPAVPGFRIQCVYKPAGDVGGDFFQILPLPEGDALVVIGDVSGKGLPAAMTVSMLVGMVRVLSRSTRSPSEILSAVNQSVMGRTVGGFTTCLILHIAQNGTVVAANAGHVPPYVNGTELPVGNGLPLGIESTAAYPESTFQLAPEDQLTMLTDGVVEARTADGELFGFERAASISARPAAEIAAAAERFGQNDDITVLSLSRRLPAEETKSFLQPSSLSTVPG